MSAYMEAYSFFLDHATYATPPGLHECARRMALDEMRAADRRLVCSFEDDDLPWDADSDCPAPRYVLVAIVRRVTDLGMSHPLATLGGVGVESLKDPYLRVVAAELYAEALAILDSEDQADADALAARATYAGPVAS